MAKRFVCAMLLAALLAVGGMAVAQQPAGSPAAPPLTIGSGDLVDVAMFNSPDLSGRFRVDEKGNIQVPLLGAIHVEGLTAEQAAQQIQQRFVAAQILTPDSSQATVFIEEYANQGITITGQVKTPGVYPALGVRMLNDVLAAAGGTTPLAASQVVITRHNDPEHPLTVTYIPEALKPVIPQVQILPGDSVVVPRAGIVYVVGDVLKPGGYVLDGRDKLTVEQAMGLAGGGGKAAKLHHAELVRALPDGRREMIAIPVDSIFDGKVPDVALRDQDVLFVPTSTGRLVLEQAIQSALSIGTSFTVYRTALQ